MVTKIGNLIVKQANRACFNIKMEQIDGIWANILYQKGGSAAIPQTN